MDVPRRIYIGELERAINRRAGTIRKWERDGVLPKEFLPQRTQDRQRRFWTEEQAEGIKNWLEETDRRPGRWIPHWTPSKEEVSELLQKLRKPVEDSLKDSS